MRWRLIFLLLFTALLIGGGIALTKANNMSRIGAGYMAKVLCSEVFVAQRDPYVIRANDFHAINPMMKRLTAKIDRPNNRVTVSLFGLGRSTATYRDGAGCTLAKGAIAPVTLPKEAIANVAWSTQFTDDKRKNARVDYPLLEAAFERAAAQTNVGHRGLLVAVDGHLVGEWYGPGFDPTTKMQSWSAAKSITATLIGIAVKKGYFRVTDPIPVPEWRDDPARTALTWDDLLRMHSGLDFKENYADPSSDVNKMLFIADSAAGEAAKSLRTNVPGKIWYYSSGSSNLLARALGDVTERHRSSLHAFAQEEFLRPLGLSQTIFENDAGGDFIGSSYVYATGRDWLRMGQLYLQNGMWGGEQILPENWVNYVSTITPHSDNQYGAHFWLNYDGDNGSDRLFPGVPEDAYFFAGRDGQYVIMVPEKNMVIVRLGLTRATNAAKQVAPTIRQIYEAVASP